MAFTEEELKGKNVKVRDLISAAYVSSCGF
jgi:hypothetical protein